jgi:lipoate-protein ligase B
MGLVKDELENINKGNWLAPPREHIHSTGGSQCQRKGTWHFLEINFIKDLAVFLEVRKCRYEPYKIAFSEELLSDVEAKTSIKIFTFIVMWYLQLYGHFRKM